MWMSFLKEYWHNAPTLLKIYLITLFLCAACAQKGVVIPVREGIDLRDELTRMGSLTSLDASFTIEFVRGESTMKGDAVLRLTPEDLDLRVYSLGFLVSEVTSHDGLTKSTPPMERTGLLLLIDGIRNSFFWWSIEGYEIDEDDAAFLVTNSWRRIVFNKRTLLPVRQMINLDEGKELQIFYEDPRPLDGVWFPSKMRIELSSYMVTLAIRELSFAHH
jgi:hypothetical protein